MRPPTTLVNGPEAARYGPESSLREDAKPEEASYALFPFISGMSASQCLGWWHSRAGPNARACRQRQARRGRDLLERERIELRHDLAREPCLVALAGMLARPAAIAAMPVRDRLASRAVRGGAAAWIVARGGLCCKNLARRLDRAETMLAPRLWHAHLAMPAPALQDWLAAHRACDRRARSSFDGRRAPCTRCIRPRLRGFARRCEQRRTLLTGNASPLIYALSRDGARFNQDRVERHEHLSCEPAAGRRGTSVSRIWRSVDVTEHLLHSNDAYVCPLVCAFPLEDAVEAIASAIASCSLSAARGLARTALASRSSLSIWIGVPAPPSITRRPESGTKGSSGSNVRLCIAPQKAPIIRSDNTVSELPSSQN
jgi:hypothetical protein